MTYDARAITVLTGLEAVRRRPAMYIGSTGPDGVYQLVLEVVQNAVDEALAGAATRIAVTLGADGGVEVRDDGRGIPVDVHPALGRPACEVVLTTLHAGGKFAEGAYRAPGGLHGVGLSCVNALSSRLLLDVWRDAAHWRQAYSRGAPEGPLVAVGPSDDHGTAVRFWPDAEIFGGAALPLAALRTQLEALAWLHPGLTVSLTTPDGETTWREDGGLAGMVARRDADRDPLHAPLHVRGERDGVGVEAALQWTWGYHEDVSAWVNGVPTAQGGTHVEGLWSAVTHAVNRVAAARGLLQPGEQVAGFDLREGLTAALAVRLREPAFEGQTKTALSSPEARGAVAALVGEGIEAAFAADPALAARVVGRAVESARVRNAARRAGERVRWQRVDYVPDKEVYRQQFGARSKNWHDSARWLTDQELLGKHAAMTKLGPDSELLDVCCGSGVVGNSFRGRVGRITGLDLTPEMIALARTRLDEVVKGDVYDIPFPAARFDMVCTREVLHLLPRPEKPVSEIFRVLKPGGQFVVGQWVPFNEIDAAWMFRIVKKKQPLFFNNLMAEDMIALLRGAGFVDIETDEYLQWEDIDRWIDSWETPPLMRHQIRDLYLNAPAAVREVHPFEITPEGQILDCWRWVVFSGRKPA